MKDVLAKMRDIKEVIRQRQAAGFQGEKEGKKENFPYQSLVQYLGDMLEANTYLLSISGQLLGFYSKFDAISSERTDAMFVAKQLDPNYMTLIEDINKTEENIPTSDDRTIFALELRDQFPQGMTTIIPIFGGANKIGYLVLARAYSGFEENDLILGEYVGTVVALEMVFRIQQENESVRKNKETVRSAIQTLSYSEHKALQVIFKKADKPSFHITASKIAKEENITRSVIVNALRKMESAGVLTSHSLGMKGTQIDTKTPENLAYIKEQLYN